LFARIPPAQLSPGLASGAEYSRRGSSTLDPGTSDNGNGSGTLESRVRSAEICRPRNLECGLEDPRAEYARRRSCDPGISDAVTECRVRSTEILRSQYFGCGIGISKCRVRSTEILRSRCLGCSIGMSSTLDGDLAITRKSDIGVR